MGCERVPGTVFDVWVEGLPPSVNGVWRHGGGRSFLSERARNWRTRAAVAARREWRRRGMREALGTEVVFWGVYVVPDRRRRDVDNFLKLSLDCLVVAGVLRDDSLVVKLAAERVLDRDRAGKQGRCRLVLGRADEAVWGYGCF